MSPESSKFHPALTITNVKSLIPITLDDQGMYHSWATLFKVLVRVHDLYHHIIPPTEATEIVAYQATKAVDPALWKRLDAAVLNWIYGNISPDLLHAILLKDDTAQGAWARLESMFQENKASRATHLEEELADLVFENFSTIDAYCNHIKSLADRLADVDAPLSESRLVLKLTAGLPEAYAGMVDIIQNQEPLPSFESCRSRLKLAEWTIKNRLAKEGGSSTRNQALVTSTVASNSSFSSSNHSASKGGKQRKSNSSKNSGKGRPSNNSPLGAQQQPPLHGPHVPYSWQHTPWAYNPWVGVPPCPYPATSWAPRPAAAQHSRPRPAGPGVLGPRPQAYNAMAPTSSYSPTDIEAKMNAVLPGHSQPDNNFYMDTGATTHMTSDQDGIKIMRCDSAGNLYPILTQANSPVNNSAFTAISSDLWHNRLGHPGDVVLRSLSNSKFFDCNKACKSFCSSCPLGKLTKLPFHDSMSNTVFSI